MAATGPFHLDETPIHIGSASGSGSRVVPIPGFGFDPPAFMAYIEEHCTPDAPGHLVMVETTPKDWGSWECHPKGDEIVIVLEGRGTFIQEIDGEERRTPVEPGVTIVNPRGVWHTADVQESIKAIYITPCPDTGHRPR